MSFAPSTRRHLMALLALGAPHWATADTQDAPLKIRRGPELPTGRAQIVLDSDAYNEIDDQYAIAYSLLSPDRMQVEAVYAAPFLNDRASSAGEGMEKSYQEILRILGYLRHNPANFAFRGSEHFMESPLKPVESPAARDLIRKALRPRNTPLYVLTIGCPVNVSSAILMEPKIKDRIVVVWLGGTPHGWPTAREFNLEQDIHASRVLFDSGVPLVQIPTRNVSEHLRTTVAELRQCLKGRSRLGDYLFDEFVKYAQPHTRGRSSTYPWSKVIWDISAVAWLSNPPWIPSELVPSPILTDTFQWKQEPGRHLIRVATYAERDLIFNDLFERLANSER